MNKSVADYVFEHLCAQDSTLEADALDKDTKSINTTDSDSGFSNAEMAAIINPERLNALLYKCDNFLAVAEQDMADFETIDEANKKTGTSNKPIPVRNDVI
ncbi:hypothetical protein [Psychrobacter sp. CAL346-MNA-CIBAN-0220]|uniref:hypothetical protein n=1 Tax=Psychrobacter sp. CAL346-MNA-CIBAN-0220 TaxID=3140457 RepID=UPI0033196D8D